MMVPGRMLYAAGVRANVVTAGAQGRVPTRIPAVFDAARQWRSQGKGYISPLYPILGTRFLLELSGTATFHRHH